MSSQVYKRNELYWGVEFQKYLLSKKVLVMGLGGVGSYSAEALARSGVGNFLFVDFDKVVESNINRQLLALRCDIGKNKTDLMKERVFQINPDINIECITDFYTPSVNEKILEFKPDYVVDAIDTLKSKIDLIELCKINNIPIISSMGAGNRINPEELRICDISEINIKKCHFAKNFKYRLKVRGITSGLTVLSSNERPYNLEKNVYFDEIKTQDGETIDLRKFTPASTPFVPPVAGYMIASYVVRDFLSEFKSFQK